MAKKKIKKRPAKKAAKKKAAPKKLGLGGVVRRTKCPEDYGKIKLPKKLKK